MSQFRSRLLCERGANIESKESDGRTPLWCVELNGHEIVVKLIFERRPLLDQLLAMVERCSRGLLGKDMRTLSGFYWRGPLMFNSKIAMLGPHFGEILLYLTREKIVLETLNMLGVYILV